MEQKKIKSNSVMRRWLSNSLLIMVLVLIVLGIMAYFGVQSIYYSGIKQTIYTKSNMYAISIDRLKQFVLNLIFGSYHLARNSHCGSSCRD